MSQVRFARQRTRGNEHEHRHARFSPLEGAFEVAQVRIPEVRDHRPGEESVEEGAEPERGRESGAEQDQQIRLRGLGHESPTGGAPGDAILTLRIAMHPVFSREGQNLRLELPVTLYDAALGAKVRAPTLSGSVNITIPPGSSGGKTLRLRGLGLPGKSGARGDLLVTLQIDLPDQLPSDFVDMMRRWREDAPYQPRSA